MSRKHSALKRITLLRMNPSLLHCLRPAARVYSTLLPLCSAAALFIGSWAVLHADFSDWLPPSALLLFPGLAIATFLHEMSHTAAAVACGCPVDEAGLFLWKIFPVAAYVEFTPPRHRRRYIQIALAGIRSDLLWVGILFWAGVCARQSLCIELAVINLCSALSNALPISGRDGEQALSALLGTEDIDHLARKILAAPRLRRRILCRGAEGKHAFCVLTAVRFAPFFSWLLEIASFVLLVWIFP